MASCRAAEKLSVAELCEWLSEKVKDDVQEESIEVLRQNRVNGRSFLEVTDEDLKELFPLIGERKAVARVVEEYKKPSHPPVRIKLMQ